MNHIIGFEIIREASVNYSWNINLSEIARIWTNGCIIRSKLMEELHDHLKNINTDSLLLHEDIGASLSGNLTELRETVSQMIAAAIPIPCFTSCLTYYDSMTYSDSSAHIIAAQRDFFGAHGFTPREEDGPTHINWTES